jgi:hypothetical protein
MTWGLARVSGDVKGVRTADTAPTFIELGPDQQGSNMKGASADSNSGLAQGTKLFFWRFLWLRLGSGFGTATARLNRTEICRGFSTAPLACH